MNKRPWRWWLTFLWTWPWDLTVCLLTVLGVRLLWGKSSFWLDGLWVVLDEQSWFVRKPYQKWGGTTMGHGGWLREHRVGDPTKVDTYLEMHEHVHVEQYEAAMLSGLIAGIFVFALTQHWSALVIWWAGYLLMGLGNWIQAWFRGEELYKGSHHEEAARAVAKEQAKS